MAFDLPVMTRTSFSLFRHSVQLSTQVPSLVLRHSPGCHLLPFVLRTFTPSTEECCHPFDGHPQFVLVKALFKTAKFFTHDLDLKDEGNGEDRTHSLPGLQ